MKYWLNLLFLFLLGACESYDEKDFYFTKQEKSVISAFKVNDTIIYESTKKDIDTIFVNEISKTEQKTFGFFSKRKAYNQITVRIRHFPVPSDSAVKAIWRNSSLFLVMILKYPQTKNNDFHVNYKRGYFRSENFDFFKKIHQDTLIINGIKLTNYYKLKTEKIRNLMSTDIEYFYWTIEKGLAAYECSDGTFWVRKN